MPENRYSRLARALLRRAHRAIEAGLGRLEGLIGDERQVRLLGDHPLLASAAPSPAAGVLGLGEVEAVPDRAAGVDGVSKHRAHRARRPVAANVAGRVDVTGRGRAAGAVQVLGDRLRRSFAGGEDLEDLGDH